MQSLSVQALALRQLGRLNSLQLLTPCHGSSLSMWCPRTLHARQLWGSATPQTHRTAMWPKSLDARQNLPLHQTRLKSTRKKGRHIAVQQEEEEEDVDAEASDYEDELQDDPGLPKDYKDHERTVHSLRFDLVLKAGLDIARHGVEDAFYSLKLRLNGQRLSKKSKMVKVGDTLDLIISEDKEMDTVLLKRVILKKVVGETKDAEKLQVILRSWKNLQLPRKDMFKQ
ncbi:mitochondrial transcription rescue factor 1 [Myxocyprinus asiaticus]|uniref:mitochondrial transcription rescue factor 1 n=1 Tax=Myxocyprinus asiaticus TaxID=70543 RepID=UPI002222FC25|nr:mitochondrial transcription rescue factor 1 [Myxocyprinus asiaticus]XP_051504961.1 mitochondrial transcription rescue factor 1 [Myxocyprinus asiaticus]